MVVPASHGAGGPHPHTGPGLHPAAARTKHQVQGLWHRCVVILLKFFIGLPSLLEIDLRCIFPLTLFRSPLTQHMYSPLIYHNVLHFFM